MITDADIRKQSEAVLAAAMKLGARILLNTLIVERYSGFPEAADELSRRIDAWQPQRQDRQVPE